MMDRNVVWIDENENDLREVAYDRAHSEGLLHRIAVVYLTNTKDQILVQKRKDGRLDHSAAGHVDPGESYIEAAKRELEEELGLAKVTLKEVGDCVSNESGGRIKHKFRVFRYEGDPQKLNPEEVSDVFWADPKEVWEDMQKDTENKYCEGFKSTLELYLKNI